MQTHSYSSNSTQKKETADLKRLQFVQFRCSSISRRLQVKKYNYRELFHGKTQTMNYHLFTLIHFSIFLKSHLFFDRYGLLSSRNHKRDLISCILPLHNMMTMPSYNKFVGNYKFTPLCWILVFKKLNSTRTAPRKKYDLNMRSMAVSHQSLCIMYYKHGINLK